MYNDKDNYRYITMPNYQKEGEHIAGRTKKEYNKQQSEEYRQEYLKQYRENSKEHYEIYKERLKETQKAWYKKTKDTCSKTFTCE